MDLLFNEDDVFLFARSLELTPIPMYRKCTGHCTIRFDKCFSWSYLNLKSIKLIQTHLHKIKNDK